MFFYVHLRVNVVGSVMSFPDYPEVFVKWSEAVHLVLVVFNSIFSVQFGFIINTSTSKIFCMHSNRTHIMVSFHWCNEYWRDIWKLSYKCFSFQKLKAFKIIIFKSHVGIHCSSTSMRSYSPEFLYWQTRTCDFR